MRLSWLSPPHQWQFGAGAVELSAAFELDAAAVSALCDSDPAFGYRRDRARAAARPACR